MEAPRRFAATGGFAAWRASLIGGAVALIGVWFGEWTFIGAGLVIGVALDALDRSTVFEVAPRGLVRGLVVAGVMVGPARVLPWPSIEEIHTRWRRPDDFTALTTVVTSREHGKMTFSTRMGMHPYWTLLSEIARRAPAAGRTGLTDQALAEAPSATAPRRWPWHRTAVVAAVAVLALWALFGGGW